MKDVMLDTNIYGAIIKNREQEFIKDKLRRKKSIILYGASIIWKELKDVPRIVKFEQRSLQLLLLGLYERLIDKEITVTPDMVYLAEDYFNAYVELGGNASRKNIIDDFIIVACASIKDLDIVVSEDEKSMLNRTAIRSYKIVNKIQNRNTPNFIKYKDFRRLLA